MPGDPMSHLTTVCGLLFALLDRHGDRDAPDLPETYRADMRAMYAAAEAYQVAEVAACEATRLRGWVWVSRALPPLLRLVWRASAVYTRTRLETQK